MRRAMQARWLGLLIAFGCGDNVAPLAPSIDATTPYTADEPVPRAVDAGVPDTADATIPAEATTFVSGTGPACSSAAPTINLCLAQAAASAWGGCTVPAGFNLITIGEAPLPAVQVLGNQDDCSVLAFVETA